MTRIKIQGQNTFLQICLMFVLITNIINAQIFEPDKNIKLMPRDLINDPQTWKYESKILAHITTDKLIYKPNDIMFVEVFLVDSITKKIVTKIDGIKLEKILSSSTFTLMDDKDKVLYTDSKNKGANGTLVYTYKLPQDQSGGEYTLQISSYLFPTTQRKIRFRSYNEKKLFTTVDFNKESYSPGDQVMAKIKVRRADGQKLDEQTTLSYTANFEYKTQQMFNLKLDETGELIIQFNIPSNTQQDLLSLVIQVTIPNSFTESSIHSTIITYEKDLMIKFYPEVGHIIPDINTTIYFECLADNKGSEIADFIDAHVISIDSEGKENIVLESSQISQRHLGRGKFQLKANHDQDLIYMMKVKWTKLSKFQKYLMPKIDLTKSFTFKIQQPIIEQKGNNTSINVLVISNSKDQARIQELQLNLYLKTNVLCKKTFKLDSKTLQQEVNINMNELSEQSLIKNGGIYQLTLFIRNIDIVSGQQQVQLIKQGERLIFIKPQNYLDLDIQMDREQYAPGDTVQFNLTIKNKDILPNSKQVYFSAIVTDESSFIEVPKKAVQPSLPAMVYLEDEIYQTFGEREFWYSNEYIEYMFNKDIPQQDERNLEFLLGIQDWRRYIFVGENLEIIKQRMLSKDEKDKEKMRIQKLIGEKDVPRQYMMRRGGLEPDVVKFKNNNMAQNGAMPYANIMDFKPMENIQLKFAKVGQEFGDDDVIQDYIQTNEETADHIDLNDFMRNIKQNSRNYTHKRRKGWDINSQRIDFTQTLKFVSSRNIKKRSVVSFDLNDQITTFRISVTAYSLSGIYGYKTFKFSTKKPFYVEYELPHNFIQGDKLYIPVYLVNNMNKELSVNLNINHITRSEKSYINNKKSSQIILAPLESKIENYLIKVEINSNKSQTLQVIAKAQDSNGQLFEDSLSKQTEILPNGFPQKISQSGLIGISNNSDSKMKFEFQLPHTYFNKSLKVSAAKIFAQPLDNILSAVESLIQEPYGCFEQCSSVTYPIVMALQFLHKAKALSQNSEQEKKIDSMIFDAQLKLQKGYVKLTTYESSNGGYEWFGKNPAHEALSAYGLMQFEEMKQVMPNMVNNDMTRRVQEWLLNRKDGEGGFKLSSNSQGAFGRTSQNITNAYLVWVLTSLGYNKVEKELNQLINTAKYNNDPYFLALLGGSLINLKRKSEAQQYLDRLAQQQNLTNGAVEGAVTSITSSCGKSLLIETTSLSMINWLKHDRSKYTVNIEKGIKFLISSIDNGGRMGSTQSTILSLKALILYMENYSGIKGKGDFNLYIDGKFINGIQFDEKQKDSKESYDFAKDIQSYFESFDSKLNKHIIEIKIENHQPYDTKENDFQLSYTLQIDYFDQSPPSAPDPKIEFYLNLIERQNNLVDSNIQTSIQNIKIINTSEQPQGMVVAIISIPSCMLLDINQFELLKQKGKFDSFEIASDLSSYTLYWTSIKPYDAINAIGLLEVQITLVQKFKSETCLNRASVAYLYYDIENKIWI